MPSIRIVVVRQPENPVRTIVVTRTQPPIKTIIINKGKSGSPGPPGPMGPIANLIIDGISLTDNNIATKSFPLSETPYDPTTMELTPIGGIVQRYGIDYIYSNGYIVWSGLGLDGFLETNEQVTVRYLKGVI